MVMTMIDRFHRVAAILLSSLAPCCVATNPDWDQAPAGGSSGEMVTVVESSTGSDETTGGSGAEPAASTGRADEGDGGDDVDDGDEGDEGDEGAVDDACLANGLARCEDDAMVVCVDLASDPHHCGACFNDCAAIAGSMCMDGQCRCPGGHWWAVCDGACREVRNDPQACGHDCIDCTQQGDDDDVDCMNGVCESDD